MQSNYQTIYAKYPPNNQTAHDARKPNANDKRQAIATHKTCLNESKPQVSFKT